MSSEGLKMVEKRYGSAFVGSIRARPAAVDREILPATTSRRPPPPWPAHVQ